MLVVLARPLFAGGNRYKVNSAGVEIPDDLPLPKGAKVWDGTTFVLVPDDEKKRDATLAKAAKAEAPEEEEYATVTTYDPRYKGPNMPPSIQGKASFEAPVAPAPEKHPSVNKQK
jgi:hypothetical protein